VPIPVGEERSGANRKALLLLSLILLVWNICAIARHGVSVGPSLSTSPADRFPLLPPDSAKETGPHPFENPRGESLTIRQKYLLGKRVDINTAPSAEISELPGITDKVAASVVEERERLGGFRSPKDLLGVKGIKEKRLQKILPFLSQLPNN